MLHVENIRSTKNELVTAIPISCNVCPLASWRDFFPFITSRACNAAESRPDVPATSSALLTGLSFAKSSSVELTRLSNSVSVKPELTTPSICDAASSVAATGITGANFRSARVSFASRLTVRGISVFVLRQLMSHEDISTNSGYVTTGDHLLTNAMKLL